MLMSFMPNDEIEILQAEFSHLNKNNVYLMGVKKQRTVFQIINLLEEGQPVETEYDLESMVNQKH